VIAELTSGEILSIIAATVGGISTIIAAIFSGLAAVRIKANSVTTEATHDIAVAAKAITADTNREVKTMNAQTLGELADAGESRRVAELDPADRTSAEADHLRSIPIPPAGG
jgi:hypothetical protein